MSERQRVKRPVLERDRPIRDRSGLFGTATESSPLPGQRSGAPDRSDPVAQAVDTGYRVIEEYMRQGENAARQFGGGQPLDARRVVVDTQDRITQMTQLFSDLAGMWLQLVQDTVQQTVTLPHDDGHADPGSITPARAGGGNHSTSPNGGTISAVNVVLQSSLPVTGHVDLHPRFVESSLQIHDLRGTSADTPRIRDAVFQPAADSTPACVRIRIPDDQPPGRYNSVLVDEASGHLAGTITVVVSEESA